MGFIASFVERRIRFDIYNVSISALECFKLYVKMPSDLKFNLANTLSEELCDSFPSLTRELSEEHE